MRGSNRKVPPGKKPAHPPAETFFPDLRSVPAFTKAVQDCRACDLFARATQAVFGEGPRRARIMLVGEQPGDQEDRQGEPFVGPAGRVLREAMEEAGIRREDAWLTNAVKHFNWVAGSGNRRMHKPPNLSQIQACRPWLDAELAMVEPEVVVLLGAPAAKSLLGSSFKITQHRGEVLQAAFAPWVMATYHPSAIVRMPDREARHRARAEFVADLARAAARLSERAPEEK